MKPIEDEMKKMRKFPRLRVSMLAKYRGKNVPVSDRPTLTKDIGGGGLLFESGQRLPVGAELKFDIEVPDTRRVFELEGKVARCEEVGSTGRFDIGVAFTEPDEQKMTDFAREIGKSKHESGSSGQAGG